MNRHQESHRIYLQLFAPRSASTSVTSSDAAVLNRHNSHEIHPPNYPTTTPGAPYQFTPSSSSEGTESSYSFSSLSTQSTAPAGMTPDQSRSSSSPQKNPRFVGYPRVTTTSAAVRLTEKARSKDVTDLLRGKFGLPPISNDKHNHHELNISETIDEQEQEVDALVLVGTIDRSPKGYIRFEHEEIIDEGQRLELFHKYHTQQQQRQHSFEGALARGQSSAGDVLLDHQLNLKLATEMAKMEMAQQLPVTESSATIRASGAQAGCVSSGLLAPSSSSEGNILDTSIGEASSLGLDLSTSRGNHAAVSGGNWGSLKGDNIDLSSSSRKLTTLASELSVSINQPPLARMKPSISPTRVMAQSSRIYDHNLEPIHIVRTILPNEQPLSIRDEMMTLLVKRRQDAEEEMGFHLGRESSDGMIKPKLTFRFYFQPSSPLGTTEGSSEECAKIQSVPAYVDLEGYCTETESDYENEDDADDEEGKEDMIGSKMGAATQQLILERKRINLLRDLADPTFLLSGYLLRQSWRDPNVWRRVYCVLSEDRLWYISRMKNVKGSSDILSFLRVGRHNYLNLHRALLIEKGENGFSVRQHSSSSKLGYFLSPMNRLPNAFRIATSEGRCHTFRAFNSQSFHVWTTSLGEKIAHKSNDGMIDLANAISEDETVARCRRIDQIAVTPLVEMDTDIVESCPIRRMDIVKFGISVAAFRELTRNCADLIRQNNNNHISQTRVGKRTTSQRAMGMECAGMISSAWEEARMVAAWSAELLHALASQQHNRNQVDTNMLNVDSKEGYQSSPVVDEQKLVQATLAKHWEKSDLHLPPMQLFDNLLLKLQSIELHTS